MKYCKIGLRDKLYFIPNEDGKTIMLQEIERMTGKTGTEAVNAMNVLYTSDFPGWYAITFKEYCYLFRGLHSVGNPIIYKKVAVKEDNTLYSINLSHPFYFRLTPIGESLIIDAARNTETFNARLFLFFCENLTKFNNDYYLSLDLQDIMRYLGVLLKTTNKQIFEGDSLYYDIKYRKELTHDIPEY